MYAGGWRAAPTPIALAAADLNEIAPLLIAGGGAGIAWTAIRGTDVETSGAAVSLRQAYQYGALTAAVSQRALVDSVTWLREAGVEPLVAKGWAVARLYSRPELRHYTDIDVYVSPDQYARAAHALESQPRAAIPIDLQRGFSELDDRPLAKLYRRSQLVPLDEVQIRVLSSEDHLRMVCLHFLRHVGGRPIWLCDVGAMLESLPAGFDWDYCLSGSRRRAAWLACVIELAAELLDARRVSSAAIARRAVPDWVTAGVLRQWNRDAAAWSPKTLTRYFRQPSSIVEALRERWPDPFLASLRCGGYPGRSPRLPYQCVAFAGQMASFTTRRFRADIGIGSKPHRTGAAFEHTTPPLDI
jgi:hypothetical protein